MTYGYMYCTECRDYQYNEILEDLFKESGTQCDANTRNSTALVFGKFQEWEPSQSVLKMLKSFADHSKTKTKLGVNVGQDEENIFELLKLKSSSIIGLRGLLNLGN